MRLLILQTQPSETVRIMAEVVASGLAYTARSVATLPDLVNALHEESFQAIVAGAGVPLAEKAALLENATALRLGTPVICVLEDHADDHARKLLKQGAAEALSLGQLWRLPRLLLDLREKVALGRRKRGQDILLDTMKSLSLARMLSDIVEIVRHAARRLVEADGATFVLRDGDLCHYVDEDAIGPLWKGLRFPIKTCVSGWAMLNKGPAVISDIFLDPRIPIDAYSPTFVKSLVMVPIRSDAPIGAIGTYWGRKRSFTEDEVELLQALADSTALAIENVQAYAEMERRVRDRTASLEAANKELEAFSYSVSHDLRSPISVILLTCDALGHARDFAEDKRARMIRDIQTAAEKMTRLTGDLLRLARVTKAEVSPRPVDLSAMAREIGNGLRAEEPERRVSLVVFQGLSVQGDPALLRIALENLLSNAWKYTARQAEARIEVGRETHPDGTPGAFFVRDNGIGFRLEDAGNLFHPFHRLPSSQGFPGTGVGLATVHRIIEKHGGSIWPESAPGAGTTFRFLLAPAQAAAPAVLPV